MSTKTQIVAEVSQDLLRAQPEPNWAPAVTDDGWAAHLALEAIMKLLPLLDKADLGRVMAHAERLANPDAEDDDGVLPADMIYP